ncbi:MAG: hypothetical protein ACYS17_04525 [Planctomycetota bacterium]
MPKSEEKTVYFFGAGASHASEFGFPCMKGFFRNEDFKSSEYPNLLEFIRTRYRNIPFEELNIEELITFLEFSLETFGSFGKQTDYYIDEARREFDQYVNQRLKISDPRACKEHHKILDKTIAGSKSKDSIITLNYDLIIDYTLYDNSPRNGMGKLSHGCLLDRMYSLLGETVLYHGKRPSIYHEHRELGFYLKLHGSIDWIYCPNGTCANNQLAFPNWLGSDAVHNMPGDICNLCGSLLKNVIVPPTMHKTFEKFPKMGLLWSLAYRELSRADKIVIFGVSFAHSDYYLRWLFKKALTERANKPVIFDIDIDASVCEQIGKITGIKPIYKKTLDEFIEG